jgi:hypothetical protein
MHSCFFFFFFGVLDESQLPSPARWREATPNRGDLPLYITSKDVEFNSNAPISAVKSGSARLGSEVPNSTSQHNYCMQLAGVGSDFRLRLPQARALLERYVRPMRGRGEREPRTPFHWPLQRARIHQLKLKALGSGACR